MTEHFANLSEFLAKTNTTCDDFAARIGVGAPYVSMLARGLRTPSLPLAVRIASEASIPVKSLLPTRRGERRRLADRRRAASARAAAQTAEEGA